MSWWEEQPSVALGRTTQRGAMAPEQADPSLDAAAIEFPTDRLTFRQMRNFQPRIFTSSGLKRASASGIDAVAVHMYELTLAEKTFARAAGIPDPDPGISRAEAVSMLGRAYRDYGLSSGPAQTRQLVRDIEQAVLRQVGKGTGLQR